MAEVRIPWSIPEGQLDKRNADIGFIFNDVTRQVVGIYGENPTEDSFRCELDYQGRTFSATLRPGESRQVLIPPRFRPTETLVERVDRRTGLIRQKLILPYDRLVIERVFARPRRASPVVLSVTATEVATGTTHNIAMPATVDAGDLLLNAMTWNGDGSATTNGVPTGWAEDGEVNDAPFGYISLLVKEAVGDEDGSNVNFTTSPGAPVICHVYRIEAGSWDDSGTAAAAVQIGGSATGESTAPNPGSLTPGWGSAANLWIAVAQSTEDRTFTAVPTGYTDAGQNQLTGADGELSLNTAYRTNTAASEDPGAFTMPSGFWLAATIAVKPSAATAYDETGKAFTITSTVAGSDAANFADAGQVDVAASVAATDSANFAEALDVTITSTVTGTDTYTPAGPQNYDETGKSITITSTVAGSDAASFVDAGQVSITATVEGTDTHNVGIDYDETGKQFTVTATVTGSDVAAFADSALVSIEAILAGEDTLIVGPLSKPYKVVIFYRSPNGDLVWSFGADRSMPRGFRSSEGFEKASDRVRIPVSHRRDGVTDAAIEAAWVANKAAPIATLKAAINAALNDAGYRAPDGSLLP